MTHWNYRVMRFDVDDPYYAIHEVFYKPDGALDSYGGDATPVLWDEGENGLDILDMMREAFEKPVLTPEDFK